MTKQKNKLLRQVAVMGISSFLLTACSVNGYKNEWDCGISKGMGCVSMAEVDEVARKQIILNSEANIESKEILIEEHYEDFKRVPRKLQRIY